MKRYLVATVAVFCLGWFEFSPAAEVKVFILAGQSNAVGFGSDANSLPPALYAPQTDVLFWYEEGPFNSISDTSLRIKSGGFVPLKFQTDPSGATFGGLTDGFGPEIKMGRMLADALPEEIAIVKFAINATSLAGDWNPATAGSLYEQLTKIVDSSLTVLVNMGHTSSIAGFFWMQGEWDARNATDAANYQANLANFVQQLRGEFAVPDMPFVFGRLNANIWQSPYGISQVDLATVRTAQANVANSAAKTAMVNSDDLGLIGDFIHFSAAGQLEMGERFVNAYFSLAAESVPSTANWVRAALVGLLLGTGIVIIIGLNRQEKRRYGIENLPS